MISRVLGIKIKIMNENNYQRKSHFPVILALTGILLGLLLTLLAVWADYESTAYGFPRRARAPLQGLTCPVFMGRNEGGVVSLKISNPTDGNLSPSIRTQISTSSVPDSQLEAVRLAPGEQVTLQRAVGPENIDLGMFIFVDALVYAAYPLPDRQTTCGILVIPFTNGTAPWIFGTALSVLFMIAGTYLLYKNELTVARSRPLFVMVIATMLAMTLGYVGWWLGAIFLVIVCFFTLFHSAAVLFTSQP
jgi:hypothetical protein